MNAKKKKAFERLTLIEMINESYQLAKEIQTAINKLRKDIGLPHSPVEINKPK